MIWTDLEVWAQAFQETSKTMQVLDILNEWLRKKLGDLQATELCGTFTEIGEQVKLGESSNYNCDKYENHMRVIRRIAEYIGAEKTKKQIDWFNLMPFDFPSIEPENLLVSEEIRESKMEWDQTLFTWAHRKGDCVGQLLKEDAENEFFAPNNFNYNCHSQGFKKLEKVDLP